MWWQEQLYRYIQHAGIAKVAPTSYSLPLTQTGRTQIQHCNVHKCVFIRRHTHYVNHENEKSHDHKNLELYGICGFDSTVEPLLADTPRGHLLYNGLLLNPKYNP